MKENDNIFKKIAKHPLTPVVPSMLLFMLASYDMGGVYDRMDQNAYNVFPDVAAGEQLTQVKHEIIVFHQEVDKQLQQGNLIVNLSQIADQQRVIENLNLLAEQEARIQERNTFRANLRPIKDKGFLIDIGLMFGALGLGGLAAARTLNMRKSDALRLYSKS